MKIFKIFLMLLFFINCSNEEPVETSKKNIDVSDTDRSYEEFDISYGNDPKQKIDLYLPAKRTSNTKIIILIHGGGWSGGDKEEMTPIKELVKKDFQNVAIANINYRLADADNKPFPMQVNDITSVIDFLKLNKSKYNISENLGFIGISAGAHLSMLWAYSFDSNKKTSMVCNIVGPTNLIDPEYINAASTNTELQDLLNLYGIDASSSFLEEASPLHQVTASAPPTILFYGGKDPLIPTSQGIDLRDKLQTLGVTHEFTLYPEAGHGWVGLELLDTWLKLKVFISSHL